MRKVLPLVFVLAVSLSIPFACAAGEALFAPDGLSLDASREGLAQAIREAYGVEVETSTMGASTVLMTPCGAVSEGFPHPITLRAVYDESDAMSYLQLVYERQENGLFFGKAPEDAAQQALFEQALDLYDTEQARLSALYGEPSHGLFAATSVGHEDERYYDYPSGSGAREVLLRAMEVEDTVYIANYRKNVSAYLHMWRYKKENEDKLMLEMRTTYAQEPHAPISSAPGPFEGKHGPYDR